MTHNPAAQRQARWRAIWQSRRWPAWGWWPLAKLHGAVLALRRLAYATGLLQTTRLPCPVLVVGNVIAGGAGKTPTTIALVQHLQQCGLRVGVISRGYGRTSTACQAVSATSAAADVGDEPLLIHWRTHAPTFVASQRAQAGQALLRAHPDTQLLICDDGLQHLALARDLSLCVFDERGVGNGWLLPAGPLREPWPRPVDWCLQLTEQPPAAQHRMGDAFLATRKLTDHAVDGQGRQLPLAALRTRTVVAFAGIAKPEQFFASLRAQGIAPAQTVPLGDHASATSDASLRPLLHQLHQLHTHPTMDLVCTEKDAVKLWPQFPQVLAVPLQVDLPQPLLDDVTARVKALLRPA